MLPASADVVIVGGGNAALCAALAAREHGGLVLVLERAPEEEAGGNSRFTAGAMRCVYDGVEDLQALMPELTEVLVRKSRETLRWMRGKGVRFAPIWGRQAFKVDGKFKFWGGLTIESHGGGPGLVAALTAAAKKNGITLLYDSRAIGLIADDAGVQGVRVRHGGRTGSVATKNVVLAAGGFQANAEWRTRYMGPGWELAKVRGTRFNTGDGIKMALEANAMPTGNWSGGHAVAWDRNAPEFGDLSVGDNFQKHNYPFSIMINANGERFLDEGADFRNYTYAKYGRVILMQPGQFCWQIFDKKVLHLLRDEYRIKRITKVSANTLPELVEKLEGVNAKKALETINAFNAAVKREVPFNPNVKDGRCAVGLPVPKSNWAITIEEPPFEAYAVTCGLTFTFGGVKIDTSARVIDTDGHPIPGLYAAGETVGGFFYLNLARRAPRREGPLLRCIAAARPGVPGSGTDR